MRGLGRLGGKGLVVELTGSVRVEGQVELVLPAELEPRVGQGVVPLLGARVALGQVGGVRRDLVRDDAGLDVVAVGQAQVLLGRDVAEHRGAPPGDHRGADARGDVVVGGGDVRGQRAERVERRLLADLLLEVDVLLDLVHRDVARALDHRLHVVPLGDRVQLAQRLQLRELGRVVGVRDGAGAQAVTQRVRDVVRREDVAELLEVRVEEVLLVVRQTPRGHDRTTARDDAGLAAGGQRHVGQQHAGVDRHVVDALLGLLDDRVLVDLPGQLLGAAVDLLQRLVERHGADRDGGIAQHPLAGGVDVAARREVHDRVGAPLGRPGHLVDLLLDGGGDRGVADVGVDLHQEPLADDHRLDLRVVHVRRKHRATCGDLLTDDLGGDVLPDRDVLHLRGDLAPAGVRELRDGSAATAPAGLAGAAREDRVEVLEATARRGVLDAVVLGAHGAARVLLGVPAADDPVLAQRREAPAHVGLDLRVGVRTGRVVQRHVLAVGEVDLADRHPDVGAGARQVSLVPAGLALGLAVGVLADGRRACVLNGHET